MKSAATKQEEKRVKILKKLYAVGEYVKICGGNVIVAGGTGFIWKEQPHKWYFAVDCLETPPQKEIEKP